jgi:AcrR family transcriptional regulator
MARLVAERADILPILGELFREHGYEGASLALITERTGLGKGSLYHFFPGGKEEMAAAVLEEIERWFETNIFRPLREAADPLAAIAETLDATEAYFRSGRRVCLVGAFALDDTRDRFAQAISRYFTAWRDALASALERNEVSLARLSERSPLRPPGRRGERSKSQASLISPRARTRWTRSGTGSGGSDFGRSPGRAGVSPSARRSWHLSEGGNALEATSRRSKIGASAAARPTSQCVSAQPTISEPAKK